MLTLWCCTREINLLWFGFFVSFAVWGHDLQEGEMAFSQSRLLCMLMLYTQMITSLKRGFATQNRSEPDKSSWNQLQLHLLFFGQTQPFSSLLLEGRQEELQVYASSPWPPTAQLGWVQRLWEVFLSLINTRVFSLQWEIQHYRLVVLLVPSLVHFWVWSCFCKRLLQWSIWENTIFCALLLLHSRMKGLPTAASEKDFNISVLDPRLQF